MAFLARILVYPIKSLHAVEVPNVRMLRSGALVDDRRYALFDAAGRVVNCKRFANVPLIRSHFDLLTRTLTLSAGEQSRTPTFHIDRDRRQINAWMSEFFGIPVELKENAAAGFPDDTDSPGPTIISTATLAAVASWFDGISVEQMRTRLRANLEIGGVPAFWEDQLYATAGTRLRFSIGSVAFDGMNPCQRCNVPPRDPATGESYPEFSQIFRQRREEMLPPWAERSRFNHFYRLAINTCVPESEAGKILQLGDPIAIAGGEPITAAAAMAASGT